MKILEYLTVTIFAIGAGIIVGTVLTGNIAIGGLVTMLIMLGMRQ